MILVGYGVRLERLKQEHIEMVRQWRNADFIRDQMQFQEEISAEMQQDWFASINNLQNNYFLIQTEGKSVGLINGSKIDWGQKVTGSGGIFIWDQSYWDSKIPVAASLLLTDFSVLLGLETTRIEVLDSNKKATAYNQVLGYKDTGVVNANGARLLELNNDDYIEKRQTIRDLFFDPNDYSTPEVIIEDPIDEIEAYYHELLVPLAQEGQVNLTVHG